MEIDNQTYRLSEPQRRVWNIEQMYPNTSVHNVGGTVRINGEINLDLLKSAIFLFIEQNDAVRIRIKQEDDVWMSIHPDSKAQDIPVIDFSLRAYPEKEFNRWVAEETKKPFNLLNSPLYYFAIFRISENEVGYYLKYHHIICDGFSTSLMTRQVLENYGKLLRKELNNTDESKPSYLDYLHSEERFLKSPRFIKSESFWNEKFEDLSDVVLPRMSDDLTGNRQTFIIDNEWSFRIYDFIEKNSCTLNSFMVALYLIYLHRTTQQNDLIIGIPVLNRSGQKEKNTVGMYTSTVPLRMRVDGSIEVDNFFKKVTSELTRCYLNQRYPYNYLAKSLGFRKHGIDLLFDKFVNFYNRGHLTEFNEYKVFNEDFYSWNQIYSMQIIIKECKEWDGSDNIALSFDYKVTDFTDQQVKNIFAVFLTMIKQILNDKTRMIAEIDLLSDKDQVFLRRFNSTDCEYPQNKLLNQLFEEQVLKTPKNIAVSFGSSTLTYQELNVKANHLANLLRKKNKKLKSVMAVSGDHSIEMIVAILAILKSGSAFLPFDPDIPRERIEYILKDADIELLLTNRDFAWLSDKHVIIDVNDEKNYVSDSKSLVQKKQKNSLAYVLYTSGTTGRPKGVMINHKSIVNYLGWAAKTYIESAEDIFAFFTSLSFDLTLTSIFTPLISGAQIKIYNTNDDDFVLYRILDEGLVTIIKLTPAHLSLLKDRNNTRSAMKKFVVGGEDLKSDLAHKIFNSFGGQIEIYNEYGPTEATVGCMTYRYQDNIDTQVSSVPIGGPIENCKIYILDKYLKPSPVGIIGEIFISGECLAKGYLHNQVLTDSCFINSSFDPELKMYRTGDLGRFVDGSKIEFIGRKDQQIKIRGYRVEPQEIESCLAKIVGVNDSIVICRNINKTPNLCAYIVANNDITEKNVRLHLSKHLPSYMIPNYFIFLDALPLTSNGKVNRDLLPNPDLSVGSVQIDNMKALNSQHVKMLFSVISEVLGVELSDLNANFFQYGGDSIKAIQLSSKLRIKGIVLKVKDILSNPIIGEMVTFMSIENSSLTISQSLTSGDFFATPIINWFLNQKLANPHFYNQSILLAINESLKPDVLNEMTHLLIQHHDGLRLNINFATGKLYYNNEHLKTKMHIKVYDLSKLSDYEKAIAIKKYSTEIKRSFHLEKTILFTGCLFITGGKQNLLLFTVHHMIADVVSWRILLDDLLTLLKQFNTNTKFELPLKTNPYLDWSNFLYRLSENLTFEQELDYWNGIVSQDHQYLPVTSDGNVPPKLTMINHFIPEELTSRLFKEANIIFNTKPEELMLIALLLTINELSKKSDIVIELEGNGRTELQDINNLDISRTVGWFTNIYPACFQIDKSENVGDKIKILKEQIRVIPRKGYGYGVLKYIQKKIIPCDSKYIRFNYLGDFGNILANENMCIANVDHGYDTDENNKLSCLLEINLMVVNQVLNISFIYDTNGLDKNVVDEFIAKYLNQIKQIVDYCSNKSGSRELTPSDFETVTLSQNDLDNLFK